MGRPSWSSGEEYIQQLRQENESANSQRSEPKGYYEVISREDREVVWHPDECREQE